MTTFDSTNDALNDVLREITEGNQLPDFQRGWVWDDEGNSKEAVCLVFEKLSTG